MKKYYLLKIKENKKDQWKHWCNLLMTTRKKEALESLKKENVLSEECYFLKINDVDYLLGVVTYEGELKKADMSMPINQEHDKQKKECLEFVDNLEEGFNLKRT
jgi:hypothetical protein